MENRLFMHRYRRQKPLWNCIKTSRCSWCLANSQRISQAKAPQ